MPEFTSAQRAYIRKRTKVVELDPSEMAGELNIVPFLDVVVNIIMFLLATSLTIQYFQIQSDLPEYKAGVGGRSNKPEEQKLNLSVTVTDEGIIVAGSGGKLAPGCTTTAGGRVVTVVKRGKSHDWKELSECLLKVKQKFPDELDVIVTADPLVPYEQVVATMDAVRAHTAGKEPQELFPNVLISAGVR
ncbi:MAG: biopolymer transporter ExbD [Polyangiales bacterium]|nr:biopolymer transporter ExbD [Myxococcales bacterium]